MFAIVADDQLFIKPTDAGRAWISAQGTLQEAPPYPQAKPPPKPKKPASAS